MGILLELTSVQTPQGRTTKINCLILSNNGDDLPFDSPSRRDISANMFNLGDTMHAQIVAAEAFVIDRNGAGSRS